MLIGDIPDLVHAYGDPSQPAWTALEFEGRRISSHELRDLMLRAATRLADLNGPSALAPHPSDPVADWKEE